MKEDIEYKEVEDAMSVLLHCSLKDKEFTTQKQQFELVMKYIERLQKENKELREGQQSLMQSRKKWKDRYYKLKRENY